jgi:hypothetical protein
LISVYYRKVKAIVRTVTFPEFTLTMMIVVVVVVVVAVGRLDSKRVILIGGGWSNRIESENWTILERNHSDGLSINS